MNRIFFIMMALMSIVPRAQSQTPVVETLEGSWVSLLASPEGIDLRYRLELTKAGWQLQLKNFSSHPLHFGFYLQGIQEADRATRNGRVHLLSGKVAAPFIPWVGSEPAVLPRVQLVNIRIDEDEGPFWRE